MSCGPNPSPSVPGESDHQKSSPSSMSNNWVYLFTNNAELATVEDNASSVIVSESQWVGEASESEETSFSDTKVFPLDGEPTEEARDSDRDPKRAKRLLAKLRKALRPLKLDLKALDKIEADLVRLTRGRKLNVGAETERRSSLQDANDLETTADRSDTSSDAPPVLENYFDKARQIYVLRERLAELECDHHDGEQEHQQLALAQGEAALPDQTASKGFPDDDYQRARTELLEQLVEAQTEILDLREACFDNGIQPQLKRYRRISERSNIPQAESSLGYYQNLAVAPVRILRTVLTRPNAQNDYDGTTDV